MCVVCVVLCVMLCGGGWVVGLIDRFNLLASLLEGGGGAPPYLNQPTNHSID